MILRVTPEEIVVIIIPGRHDHCIPEKVTILHSPGLEIGLTIIIVDLYTKVHVLVIGPTATKVMIPIVLLVHGLESGSHILDISLTLIMCLDMNTLLTTETEIEAEEMYNFMNSNCQLQIVFPCWETIRGGQVPPCT